LLSLEHLAIVVTDASPPTGLGPAALASLERLPSAELVQARGTRIASTTDWWEGVCRLAGIPPRDLAVAEVAWLGATATRKSAVWLATPVQLTAAMDHVRMDGVAAPDAASLAWLSAAFNREFADSGHALHATPTGQAFLEAPKCVDAVSVDPGRAVGRDVADFLPGGPGGGELRRLMTEIQMWLHGAAGPARTFNALWLWGGGGTWPEVPPCSELPVAASPEPLVRGLWKLAGAPVAAPAADFAAASLLRARSVLATVSLEHWRGGGERQPLRRLEADWLAPAWRALRIGRLKSLELHLNGKLTRASRTHCWRVWRARRHWAGT
jgi:hypothetical protein